MGTLYSFIKQEKGLRRQNLLRLRSFHARVTVVEEKPSTSRTKGKKRERTAGMKKGSRNKTKRSERKEGGEKRKKKRHIKYVPIRLFPFFLSLPCLPGVKPQGIALRRLPSRVRDVVAAEERPRVRDDGSQRIEKSVALLPVRSSSLFLPSESPQTDHKTDTRESLGVRRRRDAKKSSETRREVRKKENLGRPGREKRRGGERLTDLQASSLQIETCPSEKERKLQNTIDQISAISAGFVSLFI